MKREATQRYGDAIEAAISQAKADRLNLKAEKGAKVYVYDAEDGAQAHAYPDRYGITWGVKGPQGDHILWGKRRGDGEVLTATQCKMARAAIRWRMEDLAEASGVSASTIADFECGRNMPIPATLVALRQAFEANLVEGFTKDGGCGFRLGVAQLLTSDQCRAARAALGWDIKDLAKRAASVARDRVVSVKTIEEFENNKRTSIRATQNALRQAFEAAGVRFPKDDSNIKWVAVTTG